MFLQDQMAQTSQRDVNFNYSVMLYVIILDIKGLRHV